MFTRFLEFTDRHFPFVGLFGSVTTLGTSSVAELETINVALRIALDSLGIAVGVLTLLITYRKWKRGD